MTALWLDAVSRVKFVHSVEPVTQATERHDNIHVVREVLLDSLCALSTCVAGHHLSAARVEK